MLENNVFRLLLGVSFLILAATFYQLFWGAGGFVPDITAMFRDLSNFRIPKL